MSLTTAETEDETMELRDGVEEMEGAVLAQPSAAMPRPHIPNTPPPAPQRPARKRRPMVLVVVLFLAAIGAVLATVYFIHASHFETTDDAFVEGRVIPISPEIAARVLEVKVDDNHWVHKGEVLVQLDPTDFQVAVDQAAASEAAMEGKLEQAKTQVKGAEATLQEAQAEVAVAEANAANSGSDYKRYQDLSARTPGAVSKQQMDTSEAAQRSNDAQVQQANAKLAEATSGIETAKATVLAAQGDVAKAQADRHRAEVNLAYCTIKASEDGRITRKNVEPGSYVQVGQSLFAIVPAEVWVVANFKETQLARMSIGQPVTITLDAYPGKTYTGKVDSIQSGTGSRFSMLPAENATGNFVHVVQRVPVKIVLDPGQDDPNHPLVPGMSATPEVCVSQ
jgi:membrane fusion protein, multidrug efflux system